MNKGGTIQNLKNGKYRWIGYYKDENGKAHRPNKTFNSKEEAEDYLRLQAEEHKHIDNIQNHKDYTVNEFYLKWQELSKWNTEKYYHYTTTANWRSLYQRHILPFIGEEKLQNIDYTKLQQHFSEANLNHKTYHNIIQAIKSMLDFARKYDDSLIIKDNLSKVRIIAEKTPSQKIFNLLSESDYCKIHDYMFEHELYYRYLIMFLHESGLRIEEALALRPTDVEKGEILRVNKAIKRMNIENESGANAKTKIVYSEYLKSSSSYRSIPLSTFAIRALKGQEQMLKEKGISSEFIFCSSTGNPCDKRNILRSFHATIAACNKELPVPHDIPRRGLHSLRKLFCKNLRDYGKFEWERIQRIMGHSSVLVTQHYYYSVSDDDILIEAREMNSADTRLEREWRREQRIESMKWADADTVDEYFDSN